LITLTDLLGNLTHLEFLAHGITYLKPKIPILKIHQNIGQSHVCPQFIKLCIKVIIYDHCQKLNILNEEQKDCVKECFGCKEQLIIRERIYMHKKIKIKRLNKHNILNKKVLF
jgi:hypothetical protein